MMVELWRFLTSYPNFPAANSCIIATINSEQRLLVIAAISIIEGVLEMFQPFPMFSSWLPSSQLASHRQPPIYS